MALTLNAEKQSINKIFFGDERLVVPLYQRRYSWDYDMCYQLYCDLTENFHKHREYFLGNLIFAKGTDKRNMIEVVDGQQRLVTIWLILKVLSLLFPQKKKLPKLLSKTDWDNDEELPKIESKIFEYGDNDAIRRTFDYESPEQVEQLLRGKVYNGLIRENKCQDQLEINFLTLYGWFKSFKDNDAQNASDFIDYFIEDVYLLPIELSDDNAEAATTQALIIFETLNNRGMNLEDADIFKAKLYEKTINEEEQDDFIKEWFELISRCKDLKFSIDEIFRCYSHVIRGREGMSGGEQNLRDFYLKNDFSPLQLMNWKDFLSELFHIVDILEYLRTEQNRETKVAAWLQIIDAYTNAYPRYAIVVYIYTYGIDDSHSFIDFLKKLARCVYARGASSTVKFDIYSMIKDISANVILQDYAYSFLSKDSLYSSSRLRKGFSLMAFYLEHPTAIANVTVDRIVPLGSRFKIDKYEHLDPDMLGNQWVLDSMSKKGTSDKRTEYMLLNFRNDKIDIKENLPTMDELERRDERITNLLLKFFGNEYYEDRD